MGEPAIKIFGDAAVVKFDWDFVATLRDGGSPLRAEGRESQVYVNTPDAGWKPAHARYFGRPVTGRGQGF